MITKFALMLLLTAQAAELPPEVPRVRLSPNALFSEIGFRQGHVLQFSSVIGWHFEGNLMMGYGSSRTLIVDSECLESASAAVSIRDPGQRANEIAAITTRCTYDQNPWAFSIVDRKVFEQLSDAGSGRAVVLYYSRPVWSTIGAVSNLAPQALWSYTTNILHRSWAVDSRYQLPKLYALTQGELLRSSEIIVPADGFVEGRVVKATLDQLVLKTYEITIQLGRSGNIFKRMSVNDSDMFDHVVLSMLSGKFMRIGYVRYFAAVQGWASDIRGYQTLYRITSLETMD